MACTGCGFERDEHRIPDEHCPGGDPGDTYTEQAPRAAYRCGNCGTTLTTNGTCENCDRPRAMAWWEELDLDWLLEMDRLDGLGAGDR